MKSLEKDDLNTKTMGAIWITALYIGMLLTSNIASLQIVTIAGNALDAGTFVYPILFTMRDVSQKVLGKRHTKLLILIASAVNLFMSLIFFLIGLIPTCTNRSWLVVLTPSWRLTIASLVAGTIAELLDTEIYSLWVNKVTRRFEWSRVLVSNLFSVPLDSLIFAFGAFYGSVPLVAVWQIFRGNILIKFLMTLLSLPMIYVTKDRE